MSAGNSPASNTLKALKSPHPVIFLFLYLPFGIFPGYLTVTLGYLFSQAGISVAAIAGLAAINLIPQVFKFLWSPIIDITLTLKSWYVIATVVIAACLLATGIVPLKVSNLQFLTVMILLSSVARSVVSATAGSLAAHDTSEKIKGRVGGYIQSGNLGGSAVGGGVGLWLSQHTNLVWIPAAVLAFCCLLCCIALYFINEPESTIKVKTISQTLNNLFKDVWAAIKTKLVLLALILSALPIGSAAAGNLFAAIAKDWKAGADIVALITGILGGVVTILGCIAGGCVADLMNRQKSYLLFGLIQAVCALGMAFCPHTPAMYITWTLIYSFTSGLAYAAFSGFVLEATGKGAAASKFELFNGVSWSPIYLMIWVAGFAYTKWGANGMLITEAVFACLSAIVFTIAHALIKNRRKSTPATETIILPV